MRTESHGANSTKALLTAAAHKVRTFGDVLSSRARNLRRSAAVTAAQHGSEMDPNFYRRAYTDLAGLSDDQLREHWASSGRREGRIPTAADLAERFRLLGLSPEDFDPVLYLKVNLDLAAAGLHEPIGASVHFIHSGHDEGRLYRLSFSDGDKTREDDVLFAFEKSVITVRRWNELRGQAESDPNLDIRRRRFTDGLSDPSRAARQPRVGAKADAAVLISLFRTDAYLDVFLGNMEDQTAFDRCVFDMVLVDPSPFERELCETFAARHPNVHLTVQSERVGIYEAWNSGIRSTDSRYLTNANADDLWNPRSLELQIEFLDENPQVDIAYHDMYLSPVHDPSWDVVERIGFRTNFGEVTPRSLLHEFNTPANAPMWRRALHDTIGLFDTSYQSAGDWEFWIRCALGSATFAKMDTVHFCYFVNDLGMSRGSEGPAAQESQRVVETYAHLV